MPEVLDLFTELAAIPSPPGEERAVADVVAAYLRDCALEVDEDDAGARIGVDGREPLLADRGTAPGTPIFLCAHLDTVPPTGRIEPVVDDEGIVRNAAGTILGADDKSAIAVMLEATRRVLSERRAHAGIELLFTPKEEVGLVGAAAFDESRLVAQARLRLRPGGADRRSHPRRAVLAVDGGDVPRARVARGDVPGGGSERDRRRRACDRRPAPRPRRRASRPRTSA